MKDKANRPRFFQETFLVADTKFEVILGISFLKINNANILFSKKYLYRRFISSIKPYLLPSKSKLLI